MKLQSFIFSLFLTVTISAQEIDSYSLQVGFACGRAPWETPKVQQFERYLLNEDFATIADHLDSDTSSNEFLSAFIIERLLKEEKIELTIEELNYLQEARNSNSKIRICSGCTIHEEIKIKKLLNYNGDTKLSESERWIPMWLADANKWLDYWVGLLILKN